MIEVIECARFLTFLELTPSVTDYFLMSHKTYRSDHICDLHMTATAMQHRRLVRYRTEATVQIVNGKPFGDSDIALDAAWPTLEKIAAAILRDGGRNVLQDAMHGIPETIRPLGADLDFAQWTDGGFEKNETWRPPW